MCVVVVYKNNLNTYAISSRVIYFRFPLFPISIFVDRWLCVSLRHMQASGAVSFCTTSLKANCNFMQTSAVRMIHESMEIQRLLFRLLFQPAPWSRHRTTRSNDSLISKIHFHALIHSLKIVSLSYKDGKSMAGFNGVI